MATITKSGHHESSNEDVNTNDLEQEMTALAATIFVLRSRQSKLYQWIEQRQAPLESRRNGLEIDWALFAGYAAQQGVLDGKGRPPTAPIMRTTWMRVQRNRKLRDAEASAAIASTIPEQESVLGNLDAGKQDSSEPALEDFVEVQAKPTYQLTASQQRLEAGAAKALADKKARED